MQPGIRRPAYSGQTNRGANRAQPQQRRPAPGKTAPVRPAPGRVAAQGARSRAPRPRVRPGRAPAAKGRLRAREQKPAQAHHRPCGAHRHRRRALVRAGHDDHAGRGHAPFLQRLRQRRFPARLYARGRLPMFADLEEDWQTRSYELYYGDQSWTFSPATVNAQLNEDTVLERAWNYGRVGSVSYRKTPDQGAQPRRLPLRERHHLRRSAAGSVLLPASATPSTPTPWTRWSPPSGWPARGHGIAHRLSACRRKRRASLLHGCSSTARRRRAWSCP